MRWRRSINIFRIGRRPKLTISIVILLGTLLVVLHLCPDFNYPKSINSREFLRKEDDAPAYSYPRCEQDSSAALIFGFIYFSQHIQDFLYYRHCRHFPMMLDVPDKCRGVDGPKDVFLLIVIKSAPMNYERREVLRKTWAKERLHRGKWIRRVFLSGTSSDDFDKKTMNKLLQHEQNEHNDILQWDFNDTFFNLTLKQILFLEWMEKNCPQTRFLLNGDDDVLANTDNMIEYLEGLSDNDGGKHLFTGHLITNSSPVRWVKSKYYIPLQLHRTNFYPPYCGGGGYLLSGHTASVIYRMSHFIPLFPIDDVYMGMCLAKANLVPNSHDGVKTLDNNIILEKIKYDPCQMKKILLVHNFNPANIYVMWNQLHEPDLNCTSVRALK